MKRKQTFFLIIIGLIFVLLLGTLLYVILREDDPYRHFTGLGEDISIASDDSEVAFSYYLDGNESVYTADPNGAHVKQITDSNNRRDQHPNYSPDGKRLVYLSENSEGIQTIQMTGRKGSKQKQLTDSELHVTDAVFSQDGETIFFVAIEAKEFKKGENSQEGFDLFSIQADGKQMKKLTDNNYFSMNHLFLSSDGDTVYYSEFNGMKEQIYSYSLDKKTVNKKPSIISKEVPGSLSFNEPQLSPDGTQLAFTEVSKESQESELFEYELFLLDLETENTARLTHLKKAVTSPVFFHEENKIAFLENTNWSEEPAVYKLMTIDIGTQDTEVIKLDAPQSEKGNRFIQMLDRTVNSLTLAILYVLFMGLISVYLFHYRHPRRAYLPSVVSFLIAAITLVASFAAATIIDPWYGIGLGMLAAGIFGCSIIIVIFVFIYKTLVK